MRIIIKEIIQFPLEIEKGEVKLSDCKLRKSINELIVTINLNSNVKIALMVIINEIILYIMNYLIY